MNKIFIDLDGVMANFDKAIAQHADIHFWDRMNGNQWAVMEQVPNLFYNLDVLPEAVNMFNIIMDAHGEDTVEILTALPNPTGELHTADADKRQWVEDFIHPTVKVNTVLGGKNKHKWLEEHPGTLLIDDYMRNIELWIDNGGVGILHVDPHSTIEKMKVLKLL